MALFSWGKKAKLEAAFNEEIKKIISQFDGLYSAVGISTPPDRTAEVFVAGWLVFTAYGNLRGFQAARKDVGWIYQKAMLTYVRNMLGSRLGAEGIKGVEAMYLHVQERLNAAFNADKGASFAPDPSGAWRSEHMVDAFVALVFPPKSVKSAKKKLLDPLTTMFALWLEQIKVAFSGI